MQRCHELIKVQKEEEGQSATLPCTQIQFNVKWEPPWFSSSHADIVWYGMKHKFCKRHCVITMLKCSPLYKTDVKM